jgi:hypothetical protein
MEFHAMNVVQDIDLECWLIVQSVMGNIAIVAIEITNAVSDIIDFYFVFQRTLRG